MRVTAQLHPQLYILICNGTVPGYLQSCFTRLADMTSRQRLRSSASHRLAVPPVRLSIVGRRAFPLLSCTISETYPLTGPKSLYVATPPTLLAPTEGFSRGRSP